MKRTPFYERHVQRAARMVPFGGWEMPQSYTGIIDEHNAVRNAVGLFDVSHMGDLLIMGDGATEFLSRVVTSDPAKVKPMQAKYCHILNEKGQILDDIIFTRFSEEEYLCVPNAATTDKICDWFSANGGDGLMKDMSQELACLAVQGPNADALVQEFTEYEVSDLKFFRTKVFEVVDDRLVPSKNYDITLKDRVLLSRTGYTGEKGFEIIHPNSLAGWLWDKLFEYGGEHGLKPIGLGARDTLRLEMGYLLSGQDFHDDRTSIETNISFALNWKHDFIGKDALLAQKEAGDYQLFTGFEMMAPGIPRTGCVLFKDGKEVGVITSGTMSPTLKKAIGLGYISRELCNEGENVEVDIRERRVPAVVRGVPFVKK